MEIAQGEWLVGAAGLYRGRPGGAWERVGPYTYPVTGILRTVRRTVVGVGSGLWEASGDGDMWVQLHDETLTEVLAVAQTPGGELVTASPYGVAVARVDESGTTRWAWCSDGLEVNARFSNAVRVDPHDGGRWLVGTEAGVLVLEGQGARWVRTGLSGVPVRALCFAQGVFWAGTDGRGVWQSADGVSWARAGCGADAGTVFSLAAVGPDVIAGSLEGVLVGGGTGAWRRVGPRALVRAVGAAAGVWMAGGNPGGLWFSEDMGETWRQTGTFVNVGALWAPGGDQA